MSTSDSDSSDDAKHYVRNDPFVLNKKGAEAFASKRYESAVALWRRALGITLKGCVSQPGSELYELSFKLRLNIALALLKLERWTEAISNAEVVLGQRPRDPKALYRVAAGHRGLEEYERALAVVERLLEETPHDAGTLRMRDAMMIEKAKSDRESKAGVRSAFWGVWSKAEGRAEGIFGENESPPEMSIQWLNNDADLASSELWTHTYTETDLAESRRCVVLSLPLTIADVFSSILTGERRQRDWSSDLLDEGRPLDVPASARKHLRFALSRPRLCLHVLGVRGDVEMEASWTALLQRLPETVKLLQVLFIGFNEENDPWSRKLTARQLSPPMAKPLHLPEQEGSSPESGRKLVARLYRGLYQQFQEDHPQALSPGDALFPQVIVMAEPDFSRHLELWRPALAKFHGDPESVSTPLVVMTGYSASEFPSHEGKSLTDSVASLGQRVVVPVEWNPFALRVQPAEDVPPMPIERNGEVVMYSGVSGKNMVAAAFRGSVAADGARPPQSASS